MQDRLIKFYFPLLVFLISFVIYRITLCPSFFWGDGIELSTCARVLGVAHPTGYPLFTLLGKVFCALPLATPAFKMNLMAAVIMSLNALVFFFLFKEIVRALSMEEQIGDFALSGMAGASALTLSLFRSPWHHGTFTEVYGLNLFFLLLLVYIFVAFWRQAGVKKFVLFFFLLGLAMSHHMLTICLFPMGLFVVLRLRKQLRQPQEIRSRRRWSLANYLLIGLVVFLIGLTPYFHLIIRAKQNPPINWGNPRNAKNFLWLVSGGQFKRYRFLQEQPGQRFTPESYLQFVYQRTGDYLRWLYDQCGAATNTAFFVKLLVGIVGGLIFIIGLTHLLGKNYILFIGLFSPLLVNLILIYLYNIPDIEDYYLSTLPFIWLIVAFGLISLLLGLAKVLRNPAAKYLFCLFLLFPVALLSVNFSRVNKSSYYLAEDYGRNALSTVETNSLILTGGDNDLYPIWYLQEVERFRPDVTVIGSNFIFSGWYKRYLESHARPGLSWHVEQREPTTDVAFFQALREWIIEPNIRRFPVYIFYLHQYLLNFYTIKPVARILPVPIDDKHRALFDYRFLPSPVLFKIEPKN